ncbi:glycosyltransferase [Paenarthrobacter aurescens]|uniref:glycosyltransferase n=1 Tax=Paenarthrobacter aurescens TaxID=43663 RepID=UPI0021C16571|nr:glycosyltransferase [Paenarthrobacter aurescens]MCT9868308.1 glycosyltransferase [Paenarthrobacter aurescens]
MHVLIMSFGTRGDIQPYAALSGALARAGHDVTLAVPEGFADLVPHAGPGTITHRPAGSTMLRLLQEVMPELSRPGDALRTLGAMTSAMRELNDECWTAAQAARPDVVLYHPKCLAGPHIAEALGVPGVLSLPIPFFTPTRAHAMPFLGGASFGALGNRATYGFRRMSGIMYGGMISEFRRDVGLGRFRRLADPLINPDGSPVHVLYPYSKHVVPIPDDYPSSAHVTGYWFPESGDAWVPPAGLVNFLAAGEPPVYVGFGSMGFGKGAKERRDAVLSALRVHGLRGIVATGWGGIAPGEAGTDDVLVLEGAPHEWLFPQVAAVVHHGGAGSTAAGIRAGRPTLIVPFLGDQPFWGAQVQALGIGPAPVPARHLRTRLADSLGDLVNTASYASRAEEVGAEVRAENGLAAGVAALEQIADPSSRTRKWA